MASIRNQNKQIITNELPQEEINTGLEHIITHESSANISIAKKKSFELERQRDRKLVRGRFMFHEVPGGTMTFNFYKYKGDPIETYSLKDGEIYSIPLGVAKHLNNNCSYPVHEHALDENGKPSMIIGTKQKRCSFQSLDFMVEEDFSSSDLVTVEQVL